jgi:chromosome partitioning protein
MVKLDYARLKNIRLEQDITQKELATATGVNLSTIKQIETGRSATDLENIEKLCAYLEVDINEIAAIVSCFACAVFACWA